MWLGRLQKVLDVVAVPPAKQHTGQHSGQDSGRDIMPSEGCTPGVGRTSDDVVAAFDGGRRHAQGSAQQSAEGR